MSDKIYFIKYSCDQKGARRKVKSPKKPPQDTRTVRGEFSAGEDNFVALRAFLAR